MCYVHLPELRTDGKGAMEESRNMLGTASEALN